MSNDTEKALEAVAVALKQSTESNQKTAEVSADIAENVRALSAKVIEHDEKFKLYDAKMTEYEDTLIDFEKKMHEVEDSTYVNPTQQQIMREHATQRILMLLNTEYGSRDWNVYARGFYARLWSDFKHRFAIPRYAWLRKIDFDRGLTVIDGHTPHGGPQKLKDEIDARNVEKEREHLQNVFRAKEEMDKGGDDK